MLLRRLNWGKCFAQSQKLDKQKSEPERSSRRRSENLIAISPRVTKSNNIVCTHYVKVFCILCLCIILFDTSKASENLTFILKQSLILSSFCVCIIICCLGAMKIEGSIEETISNIFPNFDVYFEEVMQIAIQSMFWMAIEDLSTSSFILFTVIVREKVEVVLHAQLSRALERT